MVSCATQGRHTRTDREVGAATRRQGRALLCAAQENPLEEWNPSTRTIRLNTELAKKPPGCLEYIIVHEMAHLLEPTHNRHFIALMERTMPTWHYHHDTLNGLRVRYEHWVY